MSSPLTLCYVRQDAWPPLAWLARCERDRSVVSVFHGPGLDTAERWFGEVVWAAPYAAADFDRSDTVFGSGARVRGHRIVFVSAGTTVDRLHSLCDTQGAWISNSLACLVGALDATVDAAYPRYPGDFATICRGLGRYQPIVATSAGAVRLTYHANLAWDGGELCETPKPMPIRDFSSFAHYRNALTTTLGDLAANAGAPARTRRYRLLGTISSGYDSATVAALARSHLDHLLAFEDDAGLAVAAALRLPVECVARDAWRASPFAEVPFLAADAKGEDVFFKGAEPLLAGRVLLTGYHGDKVWDRRAPTGREPFARADQSGLSLSEYRLWAGFIHCPVPFIGARQHRDIALLSRSPELAPWSLGGRYDRPVCRRIVEEAGASRMSFGMRKRSASVLLFDRASFLSPDSLTDYLGWLDGRGIAPQREPPATAVMRRGAQGLGRLLSDWRGAERLTRWSRREPLFRHLFPWALQRAAARYGRLEPVRTERQAGGAA